ncbi:peptide deformylase [Candidatus Falkowbacteria bacterium]|nr:peptide deformylase [Candidatus Falkowbacteria bacterium]
MLKIITQPNPILRKKSRAVKDILTQKIQELIPQMAETMVNHDGVGLAAPQIGKNIRLITVNHKDRVLAIINPKIARKSFIKEWCEEGCLSVPDKFGEVKRSKSIIIEYFDEKNNQKILKAPGLLARVIQHEIDHLDGILFIDKARKLHNIEFRNT